MIAFFRSLLGGTTTDADVVIALQRIWRDPLPLLVAPTADDVAAGPVVLRSMAVFSQRVIEPAGAGHQRVVVARYLASTGRVARIATAAAVREDDDAGEPSPEERKKMNKLLASGKEAHYEFLGLGSLNTNASDDQIKKAYRKMVLKYHPDKQQSAESAAAGAGGAKKPAKSSAATDPLFLAIQKAYDVLSNEDKRRGYDSQFEFNDDIPAADADLGADGAKFFDVYRPVFDRNSRWSAVKPVPALGGPEDDDAHVRGFYNFWFAFESWRDFSADGEHDVEDASFREEKRWMMRENEKVAAKKKKAEVARIWDLTTRAYAKDPRVTRMKKAEEEEKQAARLAKIAAKRAIEETARAKEEEAAKRAKEEEDAARSEAAARKADREREKKAAKRYRYDLNKAMVAAAVWLHGAGAAAEAGFDGAGTAAAVAAAAQEEANALLAALCEDGKTSARQLAELLERFPADLPPPPAEAAPLAAPGAVGGGSKAAKGPAPPHGAWAPAPVASPAAWAAPVAPLNPAAAVAAWRAVRALGEEELRSAREAASEAEAAAVAAAAAEAEAAAAAAAKLAASRPEWSVQESSMLAKAVARFPPGTKNRWQCVVEHVNGLNLGHSRGIDEVISKARTMGEAERAKASASSFTTFLASRGSATAVADSDAAPGAADVAVAAVSAAEEAVAAPVAAAAAIAEQAPDRPLAVPTTAVAAAPAASAVEHVAVSAGAEAATTAAAGAVAAEPVASAAAAALKAAAADGAKKPAAVKPKAAAAAATAAAAKPKPVPGAAYVAAPIPGAVFVAPATPAAAVPAVAAAKAKAPAAAPVAAAPSIFAPTSAVFVPMPAPAPSTEWAKAPGGKGPALAAVAAPPGGGAAPSAAVVAKVAAAPPGIPGASYVKPPAATVPKTVAPKTAPAAAAAPKAAPAVAAKPSFAAAAAPQTAKPIAVAAAASKPASAAAPAAAAATAPAVAAAPLSEKDVWSAEQHAALERALREFPASIEKAERWRLIADAVPGKSKAACVARFKVVREAVLQGKAPA